jgi:hypothetical protein
MRKEQTMSLYRDGPSSDAFAPLPFKGTVALDMLPGSGISEEMATALEHAPRGEGVAWGIPFYVDQVVLLAEEAVTLQWAPVTLEWLVFMHTSDLRSLEPGPGGFYSPMRGQGQLGERAAEYVMLYQDGTEEAVPIVRRHQIGAFQRRWGENCFQAVAHHKPHPIPAAHEQLTQPWGRSQTRASAADGGPWVNWLWAWENPHPEKALVGVRLQPVSGRAIVSAISGGAASAHPLRWKMRQKACLTLPPEAAFDPHLDKDGLLQQIQLDLGQVISACPRLAYPDEQWEASYNNQLPESPERDVLIEYTAHPDARFHLHDGRTISVADVESGHSAEMLRRVPPARRRVTLRVVEAGLNRPVAVKLHIHGQWGEYLAPVDRHRIVDPAWFEDYSVDFSHRGVHQCTYIPGETTVDLPLGPVYVEVSKGFEIRPVRQVVEVTQETEEIVIPIEKVLPWRERGWVTADTHVHFLSPMSALLEGAGEGVNVVNLLASQWGELMTNVGDFDGRTTWGSKEAAGDGEYLVRVGTENRQHILGHISLLGYGGSIIAPMTTGGPDESAIGDPIEILLTEWARRCHEQGGVVVLPHFPNPRAEHAAAIVSGDIDAIEMTSWGDLYSGIDPYSLSDWYRYLNCGYLVPAVGGTDKMTATTAVGTVRTYARLPTDEPFTYQHWMDAIQRGETFVTYGPLLDMAVDGQPMGSWIEMSESGGTVDVTWQVASVTVPVTRVELIVNGEIRESVSVSSGQASGQWSVKVDKSSWLALLVRGHYPGRPEIVAAHGSPVMIRVAGSSLLAAADALTILEQIEGAMAYLDTVGTRAEDAAYKRMRMVLVSAHRSLHNRMHQQGYYHDHTPLTDHDAHHT